MLRAIVRAGNEWPGTIVPTALLGHAFEGDLDEYARMVVKEMLPAVSKGNSPTSPWTPSARKAPGRSGLRAVFRKGLEASSPSRPCRSVHLARYGARAIRLGARSVDHLEASTKNDLTLLAKSRTMGVILPCTGFSVDGRYARAGNFVQQGGAVALATNCNPGTSPTHSMPLAIALAVRFCGLSPAEAIAAATANAAAVLGLSDRGTIAAGQRADLLLLCHKDERQLAYELGGNPVDTVICNGVVAR